MQTKLKICAGFDGNPHEAYIYKNIGGKKYCKSCTFKLDPPKTVFKITAIRKVSEKQKLKIEEKKVLLERDKEFYLEVWQQRFYGKYYDPDNKAFILVKESEPRCECCRRWLGWEPNLTYFHHILEKRNYPEYRHLHKNIAVLCTECHNRYETMPDMVPSLVERKNKLLKELNIQ